jgi:hypothetical protein
MPDAELIADDWQDVDEHPAWPDPDAAGYDDKLHPLEIAALLLLFGAYLATLIGCIR